MILHIISRGLIRNRLRRLIVAALVAESNISTLIPTAEPHDGVSNAT